MQTQNRKPTAPSRAPSRKNPFDLPLIAALVVSVLLVGGGYLMQYTLFPNGWIPDAAATAQTTVTEITAKSDVSLSEIMTANRSALADDAGEFPDWVELANRGAQTVDITGWILTDSAKKTVRFAFPAQTLAPGERVVVFASGKLRAESGSAYHAPFRLSSAGDTLLLFDAHENAVESINVPALGQNQSYASAEDGSGWFVTDEYTPNLPNTSEAHASYVSRVPENLANVVISEVMASNSRFLPVENAFYDWVELYNAGSEPVDMAGFSLSDDPDKPGKWLFPDGTSIGAGEYLIVYCSALSEQTNGLHASFRLGAEGETVCLFDATGYPLSKASYDNLKTDTSLYRRSDGSYAVTETPTPGARNE